MAEEAKWYVVHTYSGYENAVAAAVMKAAENRRMTDLIREVNIPMETVTEITDSGEKTVERKVFSPTAGRRPWSARCSPDTCWSR